MNLFHAEAFIVGLKEGAKLSAAYFLVWAYLKEHDLKFLIKFLPAVMVFSLFAAAGTYYSISPTPEASETVVKMIGYSFGVYYLLSLAALYHTSGTELLGPLKGLIKTKLFLILSVLLLGLFFIVPDIAGSTLYVKNLSIISEDASPLVSSVSGFLLIQMFLYLLFRNLFSRLTRLFDFPQLLLVLSLLKLTGGGVKGFAELSLIPSVQRGLMKLIHDVVHQTFVTLLVPDHMLLKVTTWNFIGVLFGEMVALWLSLGVLFVPLVIFLKKYLTAPVEPPTKIGSGAQRRKYIKGIKNERLLKSIPVVFFMVFILSTWFVQGSESVSILYNPEPVPLVAEGDKVIIPITSPGTDLRDGMIHKYSLDLDGEEVRIMIMKKDDGTLATCLDACEICPPDGYAQGEDHVVCLYCRTPIPVNTLGKPGGCNPIPLKALVTDRDVQIQLSEIRQKWTMVKTGKTKEELSR